MAEILDKHPEWWDEMRLGTRELVQKKGGNVVDVTMDELAAKLIPAGMQALPKEFKEEFIAKHIAKSTANTGNR